MYNYIFIGIILDFYLNHIFSNYASIVLNSFLIIKSCIVVNLFVLSFGFIFADYYDLKFGIIPNKISLILFIYGLLFNMVLVGLSNNPTIFLFSLVLTVFVGIISFILWYVGFWGGGDFKIFIGFSLSLSFLDLNYLDYFNSINLPLFSDFNYSLLKNSIYDLNLPISNQIILYPKVFSILLNGILLAFISILLFIVYTILKNKELKYYSKLSVLDFKSMFNQITTSSIDINDLSEGMILDKYYFNNQKTFDLLNEKIDSNDGKDNNESYSNLKAIKEDDIFYLTSLNRIGLTEYDVELINDLYEKNLIKNPDFKIKRGIPFMPFLTLGYIGFLIFGDFISIISSFIRTLF